MICRQSVPYQTLAAEEQEMKSNKKKEKNAGSFYTALYGAVKMLFKKHVEKISITIPREWQQHIFIGSNFITFTTIMFYG